jgi:choline dehydrogenase-like flavoprotein
MRSGIGPAGDLARLGIHAAVDLPVGVGLQDHPELAVELPTRADVRRGVGNVTNSVLRWSSGVAGAGPNDLMVLPHNGTEPGRSHLFVQLEHVYSRGRLRLCSPDPAVDPLIDLDLLTDERDVERMTAALERVGNLLAHRAFARLMTGPAELPATGDYGRVVSDTAHLCSTCRMGAPDEPTTVVDPSCRVLGVDGLRVIDASVIPEIPRANLNLTVIMIGEHMAARLKGGAG